MLDGPNYLLAAKLYVEGYKIEFGLNICPFVSFVFEILTFGQ